MKKLLLIACITAAFLCGRAEGGFTTTFDISGLRDTTEFVCRIQDGGSDSDDFRYDTVQVVNGHGVLRNMSRAPEPATMYVYTPEGSFMTFVKNGNHETISGSSSQIATETLTLSGAEWSDDMNDYNSIIGPRMYALQEMGRRFRQLSRDSINMLMAMQHEVDSLRKDFFVRKPNAWISMRELQNSMMSMPRENLEKIYASLVDDRRESRFGRLLNRYLSVRPINVGDSLADYDIEAPDQFGSNVKLSDFKEDYILVDFSQRFCGPCVMAAKEIAEIKEKYADKVAFVNYSCDSSRTDWQKAIERDKVEWTSLYDGSGPEGDVCLKYNVNSYPRFFLFGPDRKLILQEIGFGPGLIKNILNQNVKPSEGTNSAD